MKLKCSKFIFGPGSTPNTLGNNKTFPTSLTDWGKKYPSYSPLHSMPYTLPLSKIFYGHPRVKMHTVVGGNALDKA